MLKPLLIYNPTAAHGKAHHNLARVETLLQSRGFEYDLILTTCHGAACVLAKQATQEGRDLIIAAGGDGTVNEAINGILEAGVDPHARPTLAVLPVGRGNDFAFGIGIPNDFEQGIEILLKNQLRTIDLGKVSGGDFPNGRYFGNGVGLGFDTVVGFEAVKIKWLSGAASYLLALVRTIFLYAHAPVYELQYDGAVIQQPFLMVSIMNGRRMGGMFMMAPESSPMDGVFDLCLAGDVPQAQILPVAMKFIKGNQANDPHINMLHAREVSIRAIRGSIPAHADGETICEAAQSLKVELIPSALQVVANLEETRP